MILPSCFTFDNDVNFVFLNYLCKRFAIFLFKMLSQVQYGIVFFDFW